MIQQAVPVIFIIGPTASGKTGVSYELAKFLGGQVINADVGQFYAPLSVGTAKPAWKDHVITGHLFDVCVEPEDFSVVAYRSMVIEKITKLQREGIVPIVVGGSLFYIQSLLFPPKDLAVVENSLGYVHDQKPLLATWDDLYAIDPVRARQIHPHDQYRILRALELWRATGLPPSQLEPTFSFDFSAYFLLLNPPLERLEVVIEQRARQMFHNNLWLDEAAALLGTPWEEFIRTKGLLGYDLIFDALRSAVPLDKEKLLSEIILITRQYAKRQRTFLGTLTKKILTLKKQAFTRSS